MVVDPTSYTYVVVAFDDGFFRFSLGRALLQNSSERSPKKKNPFSPDLAFLAWRAKRGREDESFGIFSPSSSKPSLSQPPPTPKSFEITVPRCDLTYFPFLSPPLSFDSRVRRIYFSFFSFSSPRFKGNRD